ncbi:Dipeptide transport system permease protein DppB [Bacillus sp. THAF10]|uniref:ABC transporter permease subunit n=1 Tax=Bacillus sp. THAF10 TaxID=2587848 RepID=UPI0012682BB7|nr:ABC transporter permease subunit [Bacillus sp. THAF10]QFT87939.1 Dipeptide transport system permease protein DppB [Bacillus sp. THAF10]
MRRELLKISMAVLLAVTVLVLIVFFPRTPTITAEGRGEVIDYSYSFSMEEYRQSITSFVKDLGNEGTLGGTRYQTKSVEDEISHYFPKSLKVVLPAFIICLVLGVVKGIYDYRNTYSKKNIAGSGTTWLFQSIPDFFLVIFAFFVGITFLPQLKLFSEGSWYNFLIIIGLISLYPIMYVARTISVSLLAQDGQDYIKVAKSKGLTKRQVINRHMLRLSLQDLNRHIPTIMIIILSNLLMVEYLLNYQGAAYRLFIALGGVQTTIRPHMPPTYEASLVLGIGLCFLILILSTHFVRLFFSWKLSK